MFLKEKGVGLKETLLDKGVAQSSAIYSLCYYFTGYLSMMSTFLTTLPTPYVKKAVCGNFVSCFGDMTLKTFKLQATQSMNAALTNISQIFSAQKFQKE